MYVLLMVVCGLVFTGLLIFPITSPLPAIISGAAEFYAMFQVAEGR